MESPDSGSSPTYVHQDVTTSHKWVTLFCHHCGKEIRFMSSCGKRTCAPCRAIQAKRIYAKYMPLFKTLNRPKFLTLTLKNVPRLEKSVVKRLRDCWNKLRRRKPWSYVIRGGIYSIEAVNTGNGWHVHMHVVMDSSYVVMATMRKHWHALTGDSFILKIGALKTPEKAMRYILKYVTKQPDVEGFEEEFNACFFRTRMVHPFGSFFNYKPLKEKAHCKHCHGTMWVSYFDFLPFYGGPSPSSLLKEGRCRPPPDAAARLFLHPYVEVLEFYIREYEDDESLETFRNLQGFVDNYGGREPIHKAECFNPLPGFFYLKEEGRWMTDSECIAYIQENMHPYVYFVDAPKITDRERYENDIRNSLFLGKTPESNPDGQKRAVQRTFWDVLQYLVGGGDL